MKEKKISVMYHHVLAEDHTYEYYTTSTLKKGTVLDKSRVPIKEDSYPLTLGHGAYEYIPGDKVKLLRVTKTTIVETETVEVA